jgi:hypothetical protein
VLLQSAGRMERRKGDSRVIDTRPDRFDIPAPSPEWQARMESEFAKVLGSLPKPITPETEQSNG